MAAAVTAGYCPFDTDVAVELDGGTLHISVSREYQVTMDGPAVMVYDGETVDE